MTIDWIINDTWCALLMQNGAETAGAEPGGELRICGGFTPASLVPLALQVLTAAGWVCQPPAAVQVGWGDPI